MPLVVKDAENTAMKVTTFLESLCEQLVEQVEVGSILYFANCKIVPIKERRFQPNGALDREIMLEEGSHWRVHTGSYQYKLPEVKIEFTSLNDVRFLAPGSTINVLGILVGVGQIASFSAETRVDPGGGYEAAPDDAEVGATGERRRRELQVVDSSGFVTRVSIWNERADSFKGEEHDVIMLRNAVVAPHGGVTLNVYKKTVIKITPTDLVVKDDVAALVEWYDNIPEGHVYNHASGGYSAVSGQLPGVRPRTFCKTVREVRNSAFGSGNKVETFNVIGKIRQVTSKNLLYRACKSPDCNKSAVGPNTCKIDAHQKLKGRKRYCYTLRVSIGNGSKSGLLPITIFSPLADAILNMEAEELWKFRKNDGDIDTVLSPLIDSCWWFTVQARTHRWFSRNTGTSHDEIQYNATGAVRLEDPEDVEENDSEENDEEDEDNQTRQPAADEEDGDESEDSDEDDSDSSLH
ncbi:hypothetical protein CALCODRAFT_482517 [Calocera cornea HHB12733]|uniref:Replication protein A OB domain-containing protein n=1 Tax=Calocera cornea HHB12733 TaxID=1353952 RepID=A0A165GMT1_9BASI|nr:hypothetical protein CALCODRAFT_482517 [Calocera cornea HHB12733]